MLCINPIIMTQRFQNHVHRMYTYIGMQTWASFRCTNNMHEEKSCGQMLFSLIFDGFWCSKCLNICFLGCPVDLKHLEHSIWARNIRNHHFADITNWTLLTKSYKALKSWHPQQKRTLNVIGNYKVTLWIAV